MKLKINHKTALTIITALCTLSLLLFLAGCAEDLDYIGDTKDGLPHGSGTLAYPGGTTYSGEFKEGKRHGEGIWMHQNGTSYSGQWKDDLYHGEGRLEIPHHFIYEGEFVEGKKEGYGIQSWYEGKRYEGYWKNDRMHGEGTMYYPDGSFYAGNWESGQKSGQGTMVTADEEVLTGDWENNQFIYIPVEMISLNSEELTLTVGDEPHALVHFLYPPEASQTEVKWISSEPEIVSVSEEGLLTPLSPGKAVVTATAVAEELEAECQVEVIADKTAGSGAAIAALSLEPSAMSFRVGDDPKRLRVVATPAGAATGNLIWGSSNPSIARVSTTGMITPLKPGRAVISIRTPDNRLRATADIVVMPSLDFQ